MKKKNLFATIAGYTLAFLFVCGGLGLGIAFALSTITVNAGGSVEFEADDVYAEITGTVTGSKTTNTLDKISLDYSTASFTTPSSWANMTLGLQKNTPVVLTINVTNKSAEREFWITFTDNIALENTIVDRKVDGKIVSMFDKLTVGTSTTKTIQITLNVANKSLDAQGDLALVLRLNGTEPDDSARPASEYSKLTFVYDDDTQKAKVKAASTDINGRIFIPKKVLYNSKVYTVNALEPEAFANCTAVSEVFLPEGIVSIGDGNSQTFKNCPIIQLTLPSTTVTITGKTLMECTTLRAINVADGNSKFTIKDNALLDSAGELIVGIDTIPSGVTSIGWCSFAGREALDGKTLTIPEGVTKIYGFAFNKCTGLKSVIFPSTLNTIGGNSFSNCSELYSFNFASTSQLNKINPYAFDGCTSLISADLVNTVGWQAGSTTLTGLDDKATAANLLKTTYVSQTWTRS